MIRFVKIIFVKIRFVNIRFVINNNNIFLNSDTKIHFSYLILSKLNSTRMKQAKRIAPYTIKIFIIVESIIVFSKIHIPTDRRKRMHRITMVK